MFSKIQNPETGKWVNVNGVVGKRVLNNYIRQQGGASSFGECDGGAVPDEAVVNAGKIISQKYEAYKDAIPCSIKLEDGGLNGLYKLRKGSELEGAFLDLCNTIYNELYKLWQIDSDVFMFNVQDILCLIRTFFYRDQFNGEWFSRVTPKDSSGQFPTPEYLLFIHFIAKDKLISSLDKEIRDILAQEFDFIEQLFSSMEEAQITGIIKINNLGIIERRLMQIKLNKQEITTCNCDLITAAQNFKKALNAAQCAGGVTGKLRQFIDHNYLEIPVSTGKGGRGRGTFRRGRGTDRGRGREKKQPGTRKPLFKKVQRYNKRSTS